MKNTNFNLSDYEQLSFDEMKNTNGGIIGPEWVIIGTAFGIALVAGLVGGFFLGGY